MFSDLLKKFHRAKYLRENMSSFLDKYGQSFDVVDFDRFFWQIRIRHQRIDDYAKDGEPEWSVWHLCSFYQDPLRS